MASVPKPVAKRSGGRPRGPRIEPGQEEGQSSSSGDDAVVSDHGDSRAEASGSKGEQAGSDGPRRDDKQRGPTVNTTSAAERGRGRQRRTMRRGAAGGTDADNDGQDVDNNKADQTKGSRRKRKVSSPPSSGSSAADQSARDAARSRSDSSKEKNAPVLRGRYLQVDFSKLVNTRSKRYLRVFVAGRPDEVSDARSKLAINQEVHTDARAMAANTFLKKRTLDLGQRKRKAPNGFDLWFARFENAKEVHRAIRDSGKQIWPELSEIVRDRAYRTYQESKRQACAGAMRLAKAYALSDEGETMAKEVASNAAKKKDTSLIGAVQFITGYEWAKDEAPLLNQLESVDVTLEILGSALRYGTPVDEIIDPITQKHDGELGFYMNKVAAWFFAAAFALIHDDVRKLSKEQREELRGDKAKFAAWFSGGKKDCSAYMLGKMSFADWSKLDEDLEEFWPSREVCGTFPPFYIDSKAQNTRPEALLFARAAWLDHEKEEEVADEQEKAD